MAVRNPNVGRHAMGSPIAKSGFTPPKQGAKDSGGKIFNPDQKPKSGSLAAASAAPAVPNTAPVANPLGAPGSGVTNKKVAGIAKFYGK